MFDRRSLLAGSAAYCMIPTTLSRANIIALAPGRFLGGLIFDVARAVVVKLATDYVVGQLRAGVPRTAFASMGATHALGSSSYSAEHYQAAIVVEGLAEYRISEKKRIEALLAESDGTVMPRLEAVRKMLSDRKVEAAFALGSMEASRVVRADEPLHNLLSIQYFAATEAKTEQVYRQLIDQIGSHVFPST